MLLTIFHGIALALGLILPLGAQNVFVFNQGAAQPTFRRVLPVVLTASLCDSFLILFAVLGVSVVVLTLPILQTAFFVVGFLFLLYMGWVIWKSKPTKMNKEDRALSPKKQIMFAMSVSLLNPHAILDTIGVIGTNSLSYIGLEKVAFTLSTIIVSWLWFFGLAVAGKRLGDIDSEGKFINTINKISAILIWGVALYIAYLLLK
ncbi:LysE/ArgO family amino acid transporter [Lederbergia wuyishanensis]|uniref:L-lysine exporter family protein LysE/ArgO n=1 Tax=Lederbergia wuyishanensis TaxID=1347903 RepID=A0ABU0D6G7_9BACI|nr:LysE/ArgO family amino acid transporter [Lederbergia wuyishanensis]MCJ8008590.1 LysE/ArgO family amino acid transporter [Lederbergia wuyishanensis]MDQ0343994.1 L-lysine exporter family protein LysE/ArgO [Lederbergia wuyishanensis]